MFNLNAGEWAMLLLAAAVIVPMASLSILDMLFPKQKAEPSQSPREKSKRSHDALADSAGSVAATDSAAAIRRKRARKEDSAPMAPEPADVAFFDQVDLQPGSYDPSQP